MNKDTILVADDDREIAGAIEKLLIMEGYEVIKAYNGMEALDVMVSNQVDLIILDIMMPRLDGLSTMMKIRDSKNIPIILLSAKSEDSDKIFGLSMGADDYVTKPFNPQELVARVKSQLNQIIFIIYLMVKKLTIILPYPKYLTMINIFINMLISPGNMENIPTRTFNIM